MHLHTRRLIALIFILIFFVCAPILILYTAGYRYNLKKEELEKTGAMVLETKPKGGAITLNRDLYEEKTPARLNNLLPDEYNVTLTKDNYYPWQKKLIVKAQETTFAEDIILFYQDKPEKVTPIKMTWQSFSPQNRFILYAAPTQEGENIYLQNLSSPKQQDILISEKNKINNPLARWSKDGSLVLLQYNEKTEIIINSLLIRHNYDISTLVKENKLTNFQWGLESDALFAQSGNAIVEINTQTSTTTKLQELPETSKLIDFLIYNDTIYYIEQIRNKIYLTSTKPSGEIVKNIELKNADQEFDTMFDSYLGLRDKKSNTYYLINQDLTKISFVKENVNNLELHEKDEYLLLNTNQEISFLDLKDEELKEQNITRYSNGVQSAKWHKYPNYIFALENGAITVIELDDRNGHWMLYLAGKKATDFQIDAKAKILYYVEDNYLWKLNIAE